MKKILIIEDEKALNDAYQSILKTKGYTVYTAYDGDDALKVARNVEPDLILLDLRMPKMNGLEFLRIYDLKHKHKKTKVIVFSNLDMQKEIDQAYELGAHKYMLKSWASPQELVSLVAKTLGSKR
jgi:two-component system, OmpR family, response regulator VicR